jgi:plasmanylethanolamine desaturase
MLDVAMGVSSRGLPDSATGRRAIWDIGMHHEPVPQRPHEAVGIAVAALVTAGLCARLASAPVEHAAAWACAAGLLGYVLADLVSGVVHWAGDRLLTVDTPVFGPHFVRPFREHHDDPRALTRHGFLETNGNNAVVSLSGLGGAWLLPIESGASSWFGAALLVATMTALSWTNQLHKWAHAERPPRLVVLLQRARLILHPAHHDVHHGAPHDRHYCITTGWLNRPLTTLRFFPGLEWVAERVLRRRLHRDHDVTA